MFRGGSDPALMRTAVAAGVGAAQVRFDVGVQMKLKLKLKLETPSQELKYFIHWNDWSGNTKQFGCPSF